MSNKPKIYGTCKAGCQWETIHRSELEEIAALIRQYEVMDEDGEPFWKIELGKEYKAIDTDHISPAEFLVWLSVEVLTTSGVIETHYILNRPSNPDTFSKSFTFKVLGIEAEAIIYEFCGVRYSYTASAVKIGAIKLDWAGDLYLYNADATIKAENGKSAYEIAVDNGYEGTEQEWSDSLDPDKIANKALELMEQAVAIDLSNFDTNGQIVETYADGTSKTTTVEFDENGNPTKITDGDGNEITLTW